MNSFHSFAKCVSINNDKQTKWILLLWDELSMAWMVMIEAAYGQVIEELSIK